MFSQARLDLLVLRMTNDPTSRILGQKVITMQTQPMCALYLGALDVELNRRGSSDVSGAVLRSLGPLFAFANQPKISISGLGCAPVDSVAIVEPVTVKNCNAESHNREQTVETKAAGPSVNEKEHQSQE